MDLGLKGRKAIVTGGTRGIGRAIVDLLVAEGAAVAFCARNPDQVRDVAAELGAGGATAIGGAVDVADGTAFRHWLAETTERLGGLDLFVSNVSALGIANDEATWRRSLEIDVMATVTGCEAVVPALTGSGEGAMVVIGTVSTMEGAGGVQPYRSVKAALVPYVKSLAIQLAPRGVRVNMVSPGTIYFAGGIWNQIEQAAPQRYEGALSRNPMGRMGRPQEVADAAVYLLSRRASFITGANLVVDGAITTRVNY